LKGMEDGRSGDSFKVCEARFDRATSNRSGQEAALFQKGERAMKKYVCNICGYVYDPAVGDPDSGVKPGTAFENLPADWVCPVCGASKADFSPEN